MNRSNVIPTYRYRNAHSAIAFLSNVFGFSRRAIHDDDAGGIAHAELALGSGMIMLSSAKDDEYGDISSTAYIVVSDADEVYQRAREFGAQIVQEIRDEPYGGRGFGFRDPEGHLWFVGTYDPWKALS